VNQVPKEMLTHPTIFELAESTNNVEWVVNNVEMRIKEFDLDQLQRMMVAIVERIAGT
jgi:hypothetical protein